MKNASNSRKEAAIGKDGAQIESQASLLAAIVENSDDAIVTKDTNGIITSWNQGAKRIFGYTTAEVIGQPVSILIPPDHINEEPQILERIRRGERVDHYETVRRRKDGSLVDISLTVSPIKDSGGRVIGASKIARDISERRRAEERLRQSEERYRVTLASIGDAVVCTDKEGRVTFMNSVAEKLTGWNQEQALGVRLEDIFRIVNEISRRPVENPVARVLREGAVVGLANHTVLISKDGKEWPIDDSAAPIRAANGEIAGVVLVFRDATKQRAAQLTARKLGAIIESSDDAIYSTSPDGTITSWNKGAERMFGYTAADAIGRTNVSLIVPRDRQNEEIDIITRLKAGEHIEHYETKRLTKDGHEIDLSLAVSPIKEPSSDRIIGISRVARDVTGQKRAQLALHQSEALKTAILNSALDCIVTINHECEILEFNPAAERTFGYARKDVIGKSMPELLIPPRLREAHARGIQRYLATGEGRILGKRIEMPAIRSDGSEFFCELTVARVSLEGPPLFTAFIRDITELIKMRADLEDHAHNLEATVAERTNQLQQTIADLEAFSFTISHDLRSPLRAMEGFAQAVLADHGEKLDAQAREYLQRISNSALRLDKLILEALNYSRIGRSQLVVEPIDLDQLVEEVMHTYPSIQMPHAEITIEGPLHPVLANRASLTQCVSNLLANAVKFVEPEAKAKVRVWTEKNDSTVRFSVQDNGIGIPENLLAKIFEPFQRAHPQAGYEGTGMGLAIVRKAIQKMGGTVAVKSQVGNGSTFWVDLPAAD